MHAHLFFDAGEPDVWMLLPMAFAVRHGRRPEFIDFDTGCDVMWYAGSLGSLGKPHPNLEFMLRAVGRRDLLEKEICSSLRLGNSLHNIQRSNS